MITATQVKELREKTGAGMMDCKKALSETKGDLEKAVDFLKRQGVLKAAKKSTRQTKEGLVVEAASSDGKSVAIIEVSCETDFVARTDDFMGFVSQLAKHVLDTTPDSLETLTAGKVGAKAYADLMNEMISRLGENISVRRFELVKAGSDGEKIGFYMHPGNKIGALVHLGGGAAATAEVAKDLAMHITAMHPIYVSGEDVPADVATREKENLKNSPDLAKKPAEIVEKIILGKFAKYLQEICLLDQVFFREVSGKGSVRDHLKSIDSNLKVLKFVRYQMGEEV